VDFLLYRLGAAVKKMGIKSHVERGLRLRRRQHSGFASDASWLARVLSIRALSNKLSTDAARRIARQIALVLWLCRSGEDVRIRMC